MRWVYSVYSFMLMYTEVVNGRYKTPLLIECQKCRNIFERNPYSHRSTCSNECLSEIRKAMHKGKIRPRGGGPSIPLVCEGCGSQFMEYPYRSKVSRFCGNKCRTAWFSHHQPTGESHRLWTGGRREYRGSSWKTARDAARKRDGGACQKCFIIPDNELVHVHHIIPFRKFGKENHETANQLSNLVCLCRSCHMKTERALR